MKFYPKISCGLSPVMKQALLIMRLVIIMLTTAILQVSAKSYAQKVTLTTNGASLESVLKSIKQQTGYDYVADQTLLENAKTVTLKLKNADIDQALQQTFQNQQLTYTIEDKVVTIKEKTTNLFDKIKNYLAAIDISGKVVDETGEPMVGATVKVKDGANTTTSDIKGQFVLHNVQPTDLITISYVGYETQELPAKDINNGATITLKATATNLKEVMVNKGYYSEKKMLSTGDVTTVTSKEIGEQPVNNPILALEGRVPGTVISQVNGITGGAVNVQIGGRNTILQGQDPLYLIDGMPFGASQFAPNASGLGSGITGINLNPFASLNPSDIESIEVLKDADATAIYGSRGANGVVIITTKKGQAGKTKVNLNLQSGIGEITRKADLMNTQQYLTMRKEAFANDGITPDVYSAPDLLTYDQNAYTDWQKYFIGGKARYTDAQASVSGGTINNQFFIGAGYHRETTVFPGDFNDQKSSVHFSQNISSANQKFKVMLSGSFVSDENHLPQTDFTSFILMAPNAPSPRNLDGSLDWTDYPYGNPFVFQQYSYTAKTNNLLANSTISYVILPGLEVKTNLGYNSIQLNEYVPRPASSYNPAYGVTTGNATFNTNNLVYWNIEPQLNYKLTIGGGTFNALFGYSKQRRQITGQTLNGSGYTNDALMGSLAAAATVYNYGSSFEDYKYQSLFSRIGYNWGDKYILNLTARRDGSSRFGPGKQYGNFGAVGAGWIFSNENFLKEWSSILNFGKLRASYGTTGNEPGQNYQYLELYSFYSGQNPYGGGTGIFTTKLPSPNFSWEVNRKLEIGLDLSFLKDRINLTTNYSRNRTSNQLVSYSLPQIAGFPSVVANLPATIQNKSWDFSLNTVNIKGESFRWVSNFNLTIPQNKLVAFPNIQNTPYVNTLIVGQPVSLTRLYKYAGVDPATGVYQFYAANGSLTFNPVPNVDNLQVLNTNPKYYGGLLNSFTVYNFQFDILLQYTKQIGANADFYIQPGYFSVGSAGNQPIDVLNRWQKPGNVAQFQQFTTGVPDSFYTAQLSTLAYTDASFIRVKNVSLAYNLPKTTLKQLKIENLQVFVHAQNLFVFTSYKGADPETQNITVLPPLKTITVGIQATL